jgi:hypothetical protein
MKCLFSNVLEARKGGESPECLSLKNSDRTRQARPVSSNHRQTRAREGRGPARPVPRGTGASGRTPIGAVLDEELIGRAAHPVAMGAL